MDFQMNNCHCNYFVAQHANDKSLTTKRIRFLCIIHEYGTHPIPFYIILCLTGLTNRNKSNIISYYLWVF